jgi:hypothetical protein
VNEVGDWVLRWSGCGCVWTGCCGEWLGIGHEHWGASMLRWVAGFVVVFMILVLKEFCVGEIWDRERVGERG